MLACVSEESIFEDEGHLDRVNHDLKASECIETTTRLIFKLRFMAHETLFKFGESLFVIYQIC